MRMLSGCIEFLKSSITYRRISLSRTEGFSPFLGNRDIKAVISTLQGLRRVASLITTEYLPFHFFPFSVFFDLRHRHSLNLGSQHISKPVKRLVMHTTARLFVRTQQEVLILRNNVDWRFWSFFG